MSSPAPDPNETSRMKRIMNAGVDESIRARLPRADMPQGKPVYPQRPPVFTPHSIPDHVRWRYKFMPAFWTVASFISLTVNIILVAILLVALQAGSNLPAPNLLSRFYDSFVGNQAAVSPSIYFLYLIIGFFVCAVPSSLYLLSYNRQLLATRDKLEDIEREFDSDFLSLGGDITSTSAGQELFRLISDSD